MDLLPAEPQEQLRGRGGDLEIVPIQVGRERRRRNRPQSLEQLPARERPGRREPQRKVDLVNVTGADVLLGALDTRQELDAVEVVTDLATFASYWRGRGGDGLVPAGQPCAKLS